MNDSKHLKERLGRQAKDIILRGLNLQYDKKTKHYLCPMHNEKTGSFSWYDKDLFFKCFGCNETIDIYRYYTDFENLTFPEAVEKVKELTGETTYNVKRKKVYKNPDLKFKELTKLQIELWKKRGVEKSTLDFWHVKGFEHNNKQYSKFLYKDENGNIPYSNMRLSEDPCPSKEKAIPTWTELKPILWGMWHIDINKPLVITEGQPDAMIIWQSGFKNVVSVPAGASNLTWIENCFDWLNSISEIYVFGDNDDAGIKMIENIKHRLGSHKVKEIKHDCKDANDLFLDRGKDAIMKEIEEALRLTPEGLTNISQTPYNYEKSGSPEGIATGFNGLDYELEYLKPEEVTLLFGRTGEGKSTIVSQICCNCIELKQPVFLYSGEMGDKKIKKWLYRQACGMDAKYTYSITKNIGKFKKIKKEINPSVVKMVDFWVKNYLITLDKKTVNVRKEIENLFTTMETAVKKYGCKLVIIDNLMSAIQEQEGHYFKQSNFMARCVQFANENSCHVIIVAHPNKSTDEGDKLKKTTVSGTGNLVNMADIVIGVEKFTQDRVEKFPVDQVRHGCMRLLKNRETGVEKEFSFSFNSINKRLTEFLEIDKLYKFDQEPKYSWDSEGEQKEIDFDF